MRLSRISSSTTGQHALGNMSSNALARRYSSGAFGRDLQLDLLGCCGRANLIFKRGQRRISGIESEKKNRLSEKAKLTFWESWCVLGGVCVRVWHCARRSQKWCQKGLKRPRSRERQNWCKEGPKVLQGARQSTGVASEIAKGHWPLLLVAVWRDFWQTRSGNCGNCWIFGRRFNRK